MVMFLLIRLIRLFSSNNRYDGHCGAQAAYFCQEFLHPYVVQSPLFATDPEGAFRDAFARIDREFLEQVSTVAHVCDTQYEHTSTECSTRV